MSRDVRVLVVDDSDFFGTLVVGELASLYGMDIESVTSASTALDRLDEDPFDCVVSDYDMPEMDGIELFERLRERDDEVPFILLTAAGSEAVASEAISAGVTDYFPKTQGDDQFEILGKRIQNLVAQRRTERDLRHQRQLHQELWKITQELVHAPTQAEIDTKVCRQLADVDRFAFAWICDGDLGETPRVVDGADTDEVERVRTALGDHEGRAPTVRALEERTVRTASATLPDTADDHTEIVAVPCCYRDETYGVLGLGIASDDLNGPERDALMRLGTTVGHALAAVETRREVEIFREAVEQADPAVVITDTDGTIEYVNRAFETITGYSAAEAVGEPFAGIVADDWDADRSTAVWERVRAGDPVREESVQHRKDGTHFHADLSVAPITVEGEIEKFVAIQSDITELKSHEQRLQVLTRVLRHNLRNDLNVAQGQLSLLLDDIDDEAGREHARATKRKLQELLGLSEKVRAIDRTVQAAREGASTPVALDELISGEVRRVRQQFPEATLTADVTRGLEVCAANLGVAIRELLENAVEHNDTPEPEVFVRTIREDTPEEFVTIEIADDGPGIPDQERKVLERGRETELEHGRSLGLWLVNWVVTYAGGELTIADAPDSGSVVRLSLPLSGT